MHQATSGLVRRVFRNDWLLLYLIMFSAHHYSFVNLEGCCACNIWSLVCWGLRPVTGHGCGMQRGTRTHELRPAGYRTCLYEPES